MFTVGQNVSFEIAEAMYSLYPMGVIDWDDTGKRYKARVGFKASGGPAAGQNVWFISYHEEFADAERMINFVNEAKARGKLRRITGEITQVDSGANPAIWVLGLSYLFDLP